MQQSYNLKSYNTFGIDASATYLEPFSSIDTLEKLLKKYEGKALLVIGGGSNILLTAPFDGLVLHNCMKGIELIEEDETSYLVRAGAGENWHEFVLHCIENNWAGLENLSLIPGSVGASPMQNIGAYGVEIKDVFHTLEAYHISSGEIHHFNHAQCQFAYRESVFKRALKGQYIILNVTFKLSKIAQLKTTYGAIKEALQDNGITQPTIKDVSNAVIAIRQSKLPDPKVLGNAGSFFKNPVIGRSQFEQLQKEFAQMPHYDVSDTEVKLAAGWLIENAGLKGFRKGNCGVHQKQALVLVNYGGSTGQEILELSNNIIENIQAKYGISLEREVNIIPSNESIIQLA